MAPHHTKYLLGDTATPAAAIDAIEEGAIDPGDLHRRRKGQLLGRPARPAASPLGLSDPGEGVVTLGRSPAIVTVMWDCTGSVWHLRIW
jgi:hypothetical protein